MYKFVLKHTVNLLYVHSTSETKRKNSDSCVTNKSTELRSRPNLAAPGLDIFILAAPAPSTQSRPRLQEKKLAPDLASKKTPNFPQNFHKFRFVLN